MLGYTFAFITQSVHTVGYFVRYFSFFFLIELKCSQCYKYKSDRIKQTEVTRCDPPAGSFNCQTN